MEQEYLQWKKWYGEEKAELVDLPKSFKDISLFLRLLVLRAMRPDRLTNALKEFVNSYLGSQFTEQDPFNMEIVYSESKPSIPIFFVLFPGVDPTPEVEKIGEKYGITQGNGKFVNISMGQGQEEIAKKALVKAAQEGGWIMVQNVHLMQKWMKIFERDLEVVCENVHADFRCFISSEPPPLPFQQIIPESILQNSIKISNEAPQDLKANLKRAFAKFGPERFEQATKPAEFKALLFGLCMFHSLILGRRKFGYQGWSRKYNFNDGDLTICADVLHNYLKNYDTVPYSDLQYIYGEIMYGGHITDNWDRRTNATYLLVLIQPEIMNGMQLTLAPGFKSPDPLKFERDSYAKYIVEKLPAEIPQMFGLHPNAEIGYLTTTAEFLFDQIMQVQGGGSGGGKGRKEDIARVYIDKFLEELPEQFFLLEITQRAEGNLTPYVVVVLQECERMNILLNAIKVSLTDLDAGLKGQLNITDAMENLSTALSLNKVPASWESIAYFSLKTLSDWF
jgi:dynein heavy chain, axonemal